MAKGTPANVGGTVDGNAGMAETVGGRFDRYADLVSVAKADDVRVLREGGCGEGRE